jgi:hypothetical protein
MLQINLNKVDWQWLSKECSKLQLLLGLVLLDWLMEMQECRVMEAAVPWPQIVQFIKALSLVVGLELMTVETLTDKNLKDPQQSKAACMLGMNNLYNIVH